METKRPFLTKFAKPTEDEPGMENGQEKRRSASRQLSETTRTRVGGETTDDS